MTAGLQYIQDRYRLPFGYTSLLTFSNQRWLESQRDSFTVPGGFSAPPVTGGFMLLHTMVGAEDARWIAPDKPFGQEWMDRPMDWLIAPRLTAVRKKARRFVVEARWRAREAWRILCLGDDYDDD